MRYLRYQCSASITPVNAAIGQTLDIKARSAVLMEPNTGRVLYENNPDEKAAAWASITKIMSLLLVGGGY